jgi:hypothetical protein
MKMPNHNARKQMTGLEEWEARILHHFAAQGKKGLRPLSDRQLKALDEGVELPAF